MHRVKIVSDGTRAGTRIFDPDADKEIKNVTECAIFISKESDFEPRAILTMQNVPMELIAKLSHLESDWLHVDVFTPADDVAYWVSCPYGPIPAFGWQGVFYPMDYKRVPGTPPRMAKIEGVQAFTDYVVPDDYNPEAE